MRLTQCHLLTVIFAIYFNTQNVIVNTCGLVPHLVITNIFNHLNAISNAVSPWFSGVKISTILECQRSILYCPTNQRIIRAKHHIIATNKIEYAFDKMINAEEEIRLLICVCILYRKGFLLAI